MLTAGHKVTETSCFPCCYRSIDFTTKCTTKQKREGTIRDPPTHKACLFILTFIILREKERKHNTILHATSDYLNASKGGGGNCHHCHHCHHFVNILSSFCHQHHHFVFIISSFSHHFVTFLLALCYHLLSLLSLCYHLLSLLSLCYHLLSMLSLSYHF